MALYLSISSLLAFTLIIVTHFMAIQVGQRLGSLEVTALIGKGGMGEVYRARDTKLKREVAIKNSTG